MPIYGNICLELSRLAVGSLPAKEVMANGHMDRAFDSITTRSGLNKLAVIE